MSFSLGASPADRSSPGRRARAEPRSPSPPDGVIQHALDRWPGVIWCTDANLRFTMSRGTGLRSLGLDPDQVVGMTIAEFIGTDDPGAPPLAAHLRALEGRTAEYAGTWAGRSYRAIVDPLTDASGAVVGTVGFALDVTEQERERELLTAVLGSTADGIAAVDLDGQGLFANTRFARIFRLPTGEDGSKDADATLDQARDLLADRESFETWFASVLRTPAETIRILSLKDGRLVEHRSSPLLHEGEVAGRVCSYVDVTDRERADAELRASEERFKALLESASESVVAVDEEGIILLVNGATERLFGYERDELIGQPVEMLLPSELRERHASHRRTFNRTHPANRPMVTREHLACLRKDGTTFQSSIGLAPVETMSGSLVLALLTDVTERDRTARDLQRQARRLEIQHEVDLGILSARSVDEIARAALARIREIVPCDHAMVNLVDPADDVGRVIAIEGSEIDVAAVGASTRLDDLGTWIQAHREGHPFVVDDLAEIPDRSQILDGFLAEGFRSILSVPFLRDGRPTGALSLASRRPRAFDEAAVETARDLADGLSVAIASSNLREALEQRAHELERTVEHLRRTDLARQRLFAGLVEAAERERKRIASDIHDDSIQKLTALSMRLQLLSRRHPELGEDEQTAKLLETAERATASLRGLVFDLRPQVLDQDGLSSALRLYLDERMGDAGLQRELEDNLVEEPSVEKRVVLYRIAQEALTNARKHARADRVRVILDNHRGGFRIRVVDDGAGFAAGETDGDGIQHFGLVDMGERAELAGGWLRVESEPGSGTTVECWLPA